MTSRPIRPNRPQSPAVPRPAHPAPGPAQSNPLSQPATRWQRTVRYVWDKGGSKGGR